MADSFKFQRNYAELIRVLDESEQLVTYEAIVNYALDGVEPTSLPIKSGLIFDMVKKKIDISNTRREAGRKGGLLQAKHNFASSKTNLLQAKVKQNFKEKEKEKENIPPPAPPFIKEKEKEKENLSTIYLSACEEEIFRQKIWEAIIGDTESLRILFLRNGIISTFVEEDEIISAAEKYYELFYSQLVVARIVEQTANDRREAIRHFNAWLPRYVQLEKQQSQDNGNNRRTNERPTGNTREAVELGLQLAEIFGAASGGVAQ